MVGGGGDALGPRGRTLDEFRLNGWKAKRSQVGGLGIAGMVFDTAHVGRRAADDEARPHSRSRAGPIAATLTGADFIGSPQKLCCQVGRVGPPLLTV